MTGKNRTQAAPPTKNQITVAKLTDEVERLRAENAQLRSALEWYGDKALLCRDDWRDPNGTGIGALRDDAGEHAREALKEGQDG